MKNKFCVVLKKSVDSVEVDSLLQCTKELSNEEWQELVYVVLERIEEINDVLYYEEEENILKLLEPWEVKYGKEGASLGKFLDRMNRDIQEMEFTVTEYEDG